MASPDHTGEPAFGGADLQHLVVGLLVSLPHVQAAWILTPDDQGRMRLSARALKPPHQETGIGGMRMDEAGLESAAPVLDAWEQGQAVTIEFDPDADVDADVWRLAALAHGWRSVALVPLRGRKGPNALLALCADRPHHFSAAPVRALLAQLETSLGRTIGEQADHAATERTRLLYQALFMGGEALLSARTERAALRAVCRRLAQSGLFVAACIGQPDETGYFRYDLASAGSGAKPAAQMAQHVNAEGSELLLGLQAWRQHARC